MNKEALVSLAREAINSSEVSLKDFRETHLHLFNNHGLTTKNPEFYRDTNIESFFEKVELSAEAKSALDPQNYVRASFANIILDGRNHIAQEQLPSGVKVSSLKERFNEFQHMIQSENALTHLHHAKLEDGIIIEVEKNAEVTTPLRILSLINDHKLSANLIIVKAHPFSKLTLVEETAGLIDTYAVASEIYIDVAVGAKVEHVQIDNGKGGALHHGSSIVNVQKDASYKNLIFHLNGQVNRRNLDLKLLETGANGESYNLYLTNGNEHSDINTVIHHLAPDTTSSQIAKGILDDESKGVFTGCIHIHPGSQRVASGQLNKNLLLSKKAQVFSQPQLEIFADDVKCSHGSTTGQLSDDEVFYFAARGIPAEKAKTLLAHGFGLEIVQKIENEVLRKYTEGLVMDCLRNKFHWGGAE